MWWQRHLSEFVTLFLVINPFGVLPAFLAIAASFDPPARRKLAVNAVLIAFAVLVFFAIAGDFLMARIGISIRAFQIAGGIVLFLIALEMIRGETHGDAHGGEESRMAIAIYPLAIPKIAGPGAMLTLMLLTDDDRFNFLGQMATVVMLAIVLAIVLLVLLASGPISRLIGTTGASVISRVMGMLLAALAVGVVLSAVGEWLNLPPL